MEAVVIEAVAVYERVMLGGEREGARGKGGGGGCQMVEWKNGCGLKEEERGVS